MFRCLFSPAFIVVSSSGTTMSGVGGGYYYIAASLLLVNSAAAPTTALFYILNSLLPRGVSSLAALLESLFRWRHGREVAIEL